MRKLTRFSAFFIGLITITTACKEDEVSSTPDRVVQRTIDIEVINNYIADQGYDFNPEDTTSTGARYIILDEGNGDSIKTGDIVDLYFVGRFTDHEIFVTNIDTVDINNGTYDSLYSYPPIRFTHTETGWAIKASYASNPFFGTTFPVSLLDGITAVISRMKTGGKAEVIIPSVLINVPKSKLNKQVLVFEIYPVYKR